MRRMIQEDAEQAAKVDRHLDAMEESANEPARPWWEDDPVLAERFTRGQ